MKLNWIRGNHTVSYTRPDVWFVLGQRGGGKSSFLEHVGENYLEAGAGICDLFGSRDGEGLAWLRSPWAKDKSILLLKGENVDVESSFNVKQVDAVTVNDLEQYDIVISASPLYLSIDQEFSYAAKVTDLLYSRLQPKKLIYLICREAANFYYSRLKVSENQTFAKANMVYCIRESRHVWLALGLDSIRYYAIDIDIRSLSDFMVLKTQGLPGLPQDLNWLYSYVEPHLIRKLKPSQFVLLANDGSIGYGVFPEVDWHKKEREGILANVGVKVERGEILKEAVNKGMFKTVGDKEHAHIIIMYGQGLSYIKIAGELKRSSRTIMTHVQGHNTALERSGFCPACKRVGSEYSHKACEKASIIQ